MKMQIGFKTANPALTNGIVDVFYTPLVAAGIAPVVMSIDSSGHCYDVQKLVEGTPLEGRAVMHFRRTGDPGDPVYMDVPDYDADPVDDAERMWQWHISRWPRELRKDLVWTGITNEPRQEASEWLARHAYRLCELALRDGHRLTVFGWAAGTPREDAWTKPEMTRLLALLRQHPERLALGLHEYSYETDTLDSPLVGRWTRFVPRPWPSILFLEFGWAYDGAPEHPAGLPQIVEAYRKWYAYPQVKGLGLWTLDKGRGGRDLPNVIHRYMGPLAAAVRDNDFDTPPLGEEPTPPEPPADYLLNGSFEGGWYHPDGVPELQMPSGWTLKWRDGTEPGWANPFDGAAHARFVRPEIRTLPAAQLPPDERPVFIRDGVYTLKAFKGNGSLYFSLMQTAAVPAPGRYRLRWPVWPDLVARYENTVKVFSTDPNAGLARLRVGPVVVTGTPGDGPFGGGWLRLAPGEWNELATEFEIAGGAAADLRVDFLLPFPLPQNGIFADGWSLEAVTPLPPPPPVEPEPERHKAIILKVPQAVTAAEWARAAEYAHQFRHTMTASHDDMLALLRAGRADSYVKLAWPSRQADVAALITAAGYRWEPLFDEPESPLAGLALGHLFAYRYALTSPFDATRDYGNGRHEGADFDVIGGAADNKTDVLAVWPGVVDRSVDSTGGYGKYVRVRHERGGAVFYTRYCHLDRRYVEAGQPVAQGQPVGEIGTSGFVTGEHVHLNLEAPGWGLTGYVVDGVVDPVPYLPAGRETLPPLPAAVGTTGTVDLLPFLRGDDGRQFDMGYPGGTQNVQVRRLGERDWLYVKGESGEYERLGLRDWNGAEWIFRFEDTSESPERFYAHYLSEGGAIGAPWFPRLAVVGRWYETVKYVRHYLKAGCAPQNGGTVTDRLRLVSAPRAVTWADSLARLESVVTLEWAAGEQYDFAAGRGCVAFRDAERRFWFIGDVHGRPDKQYRKPGCLDVGW